MHMRFKDLLYLYKVKHKTIPFDTVILDTRLDRDILITEICRECGDLVVLSDVCTTSQLSIITSLFFRRIEYPIKKMLDALHSEYNPIENYSSTETIKRTTENNNNSTRDNEYITQTSAYNENDFVNKDKNISTDVFEETNKNSENAQILKSGNIGVTTSQQMIESELDLRKFDIYKYIVDEYKKEVCVLVY